MNKRKTLSSMIGLAVCALDARTDGAIQLFPAGRFDAPRGAMQGQGPWYIDDEIAAALIERIHQRQNKILIDYEHQTLRAAKNGQPVPAAGWLNPTDINWVPGEGIYAASPEWTDKAQAFINDDEYKYLSPVFAYDKQGHVVDLVNVALTNEPAIDGMEEIMLAAASLLPQPQQEDASMNEQTLKMLRQAFGLKAEAGEQDVVAALTSISEAITNMASTLELKDVEGVAALTAIGDQLKDLKKKADENETAIAAARAETPGDAMTVIREQGDQIAALTQRLDGGEMDTMIAAAKAEGKLVPSQEKWARSLGVDSLKSFLESAPRVAALTRQQTNGHEQEFDKDGKAVLDEQQLAVCTQMNIDPEEYAKSLKQEA